MVQRDDARTLAEAHELTGLLFRVTDRARRDFEEAIRPLGLTPPLARMVLLLEQPQPMRAIADHLNCDASNVTGLTDRLTEKGLVERVAGSDRRVTLVTLTSSGRRLRTRLVGAVAAGSTVISELSEAQRSRLKPLLVAMLD